MLSKVRTVLGLDTMLDKALRKHRPPYGFHGGLQLDTSKTALCAQVELRDIVDIKPPALLTIPLISYSKKSLSPQVHLNEYVKRGQALATDINSPVSGVVEAIEHRQIIHPGGLRTLSIVIRNDGLDTPINRIALNQAHPQEQEQEQEQALC